MKPIEQHAGADGETGFDGTRRGLARGVWRLVTRKVFLHCCIMSMRVALKLPVI